MDKKIVGVMITDISHEKSMEEIIREGMRIYKESFEGDATHAVIWEGHVEEIEVDELIIRKKPDIEPDAALVGREIEPIEIISGMGLKKQ